MKVLTVGILFVVFGISVSANQRKGVTLDGDELESFEVAKQYMHDQLKDTDTPFVLGHFFVWFEGHHKYVFNPKLAPGEKPSLFMKTKYGYRVEVTVDPKTMKVTSAEAQP